VSPGWDATPRAAEFGKRRPRRYPWSPIVINREPAAFRRAVAEGLACTLQHSPENPQLFVASFNEWSEGHYLEPCERYGMGWLQAIQQAVEDLWR
jgi:hypothetical protein